ncbi:MAG: Fe-S assembly protein IscX [Candidatus Cloacimonadota bacterium]|nr:MAG: Fe-S assembly protein IscX [Candidatus Cloacimonadota bacterium]PCJ20135.1 MAG: Fe-S assembly protein IscX [Candidatus Cloacimonadota bacterium]
MLDWKNIEDIAIELYEGDPSFNPLTIRFTDLRDRVLNIESFIGKQDDCNEGRLEAIQMAWLEEFQLQ